MFKKLVVAVTTIALVATLAGCGKKTPEAPKTQSPQQNSSDQAAHPAETPAQSQAGAKIDAAQVESKVNDLLKSKYPGEWKLSGTTLSKGNYTENNKYEIVDNVSGLFPGNMGVSIFVGQERISTSIQQQGGQRPLSYQGSGAETVAQVLKDGKTATTESSGNLKVYLPLKSGSSTVAVMTVSVPQQ